LSGEDTNNRKPAGLQFRKIIYYKIREKGYIAIEKNKASWRKFYMPEKAQTIAVAGYDAARLQAIAYGALEQLSWTIKYAGDNIIIGYTPKTLSRYDNEITVNTQDNQLTVTSKMIHGEAFDMMGRTKKDIEKFLAAFETVKARATDLNTGEWNEKIEILKGETIKVAEQEIKQAEEVDKVMNLSTGNLYITYGIIGINVLVFVLMVLDGVGLFEPSGGDIIRWGGNYGPLTLTGDWWRLLSSVFVHIGIIHIAFNMYAFYMVGVFLEPMLGKTRYIVAYLCTGVFASLASLWWHNDPVPSAGASGAIFGMYGVFLAMLSTNLIPKHIRNGLLQSIGVFIVFNLVYGMKSGVDNSAHVGGLLSGLVIGYLYYMFGMKGENAEKKKMPVVAAIAILTAVVAFFYLDKNKESSTVRNKIKSELEQFTYKDADKFNEKYDSIIEMQNRANTAFKDKTQTDDQLAEKLKSISLPEWEKADFVVKEIKTYNVSDKAKHKADVMQRYIDLQKERIGLILKLIMEKDESINAEINKLDIKIDETVKELDQL
jgi:rhomboid protease GluP